MYEYLGVCKNNKKYFFSFLYIKSRKMYSYEILCVCKKFLMCTLSIICCDKKSIFGYVHMSYIMHIMYHFNTFYDMICIPVLAYKPVLFLTIFYYNLLTSGISPLLPSAFAPNSWSSFILRYIQST